MRQRSIKDYRWWPGCAHPLITWCGRAAGDHWMNSANSGQHTGHYLPVMIAPFYRSQPRAWLRNLFWTKWESQIRSYRYSADISFISSVQRLLALAPQSHNSSTEFGGSVFFMACRRKLRLASPPFASGSVSSAKLEGQNSIIQLLYQSLITTNLESARRPHHLQNPQNRPWYRFCNRLADRPLGGMGESGTSRMEAEWPTPSLSRADGGRGRG